jgi:DNA-binding CsgD family transcriptional regulator
MKGTKEGTSLVDWAAVQAHYDDGHTIDECKAKFGFSYGAWHKAVVRGDLTTRLRSDGQLSLRTRDRVGRLLASGKSQAAVSRILGISKSTVAFHCRRLGVRADPRFAKRYDWGEVQRAIDTEDLSMRECLIRFGFCRATWADAVRRGDIVPRPSKIPIEQLLVRSRKGTSRGNLKRRLIQEGLKECHCEGCGISEWRGRPLSLQLHHVNGDGLDNRLHNLQLLCGNCHSQTDNWSGRGIRRRVGTEPQRRPAC